MNTNGLIGRAVKRVEDKRFTTGHGNYTDDIILPQQTYAVFVRSQYAHAKILSVDTNAAKEMPGVIAIFTGADLAAASDQPAPPSDKFCPACNCRLALLEIMSLRLSDDELERWRR